MTDRPKATGCTSGRDGPGIIGAMTERGLPSMDGAPACPFVAFGDDRDGRSTSPDHRHRCFAESPPAPRAVAHQEAYCLSSAFPVCPTFQDWAKREAAHARGAGERAETPPTAIASPAEPPHMPDMDDAGTSPPPRGPADEPPVRRNPPRDWAAPPPWAAGAGASARSSGAAGAGDVAAADLLASKSVEGQGLAGSAADRLAGGPEPGVPSAAWSASAAGAASTAPDEDLAGLVQGRPAGSSSARSGADAYPPPTRTGRRPAVSSTRPTGEAVPGPSWERMRRYEAYPTIRTRAHLPGLPRIGLLAGAVAIAALTLFMLPALLHIGGGGGSSSASPSASHPAATGTPAPTVQAGPTPQVYVVKKGDTMLKIARKFGVTVEAILAANPDIKNQNVIAEGQQIIIPTPVAGEPSASPSAAASAKASAKASTKPR